MSHRHRCTLALPAAGLLVLAVVALVPSAAQAQAVHSIEGCVIRVGRPHKEARCVACIERGGVFHKRGVRGGVCRMPAPEPAPVAVPVPVASGDEILLPEGCMARVKHRAKRASCLACVRRGGVFHKWMTLGGACRVAIVQEPHPPALEPPPPAPILDLAADRVEGADVCRARIRHPAKRAACLACVGRGGVFHKWERLGGTCHVPTVVRVAAPPAPEHGRPDGVHTEAGCGGRVLMGPKRARCLQCVRAGGVFHKFDGGLAGSCWSR